MKDFLKRWKEKRRRAFIKRELNRYIRCPTCGSRRLAAYGFGVYSRSFKCGNGHTFSQPFIDDLCP